MPVRKRLHITGPAAVFVTTAVKDWTPIFTDPPLAREVTLQLRETASHFGASIIAYVMQAFKVLTTMRIVPLVSSQQRAQFGDHRKFQFWRPRFDDLIIWSEKQFRMKVEYIHNNPVKAGLCRQATDYAYSSARDWLLSEEGALPIDKSWNWQGLR